MHIHSRRARAMIPTRILSCCRNPGRMVGGDLSAKRPRNDDAVDDALRCPVRPHADVPTDEYSTALLCHTPANVDFPKTHTRTRVGRNAFDQRLASVLASFSAFTSNGMDISDSQAVVLQCAAGVGKTFACITFRRGQLMLSPSVEYVPFCVYLGLGKIFPLSWPEEEALQEEQDEREYNETLMAVLYQRLVFGLNGTLDAVKRHDAEETPDPFAAALDGVSAEEWVQRLSLPAKDDDYKYRKIWLPEDVGCIVRLVKELRSHSTKRLAVLVCVDDADELKKIAGRGLRSDGNACRALRPLRDLQVAVFNATRGEAILLPILTGHFAMSFSESEASKSNVDGKIVMLGANDESLMAFDDFKKLVNACQGNAIDLGEQLETYALAHYPHVREMVENPWTAGVYESVSSYYNSKYEDPLSEAELSRADALEIAKAAFMQRPINLSSFRFPLRYIPIKWTEENAELGIPIVSLLLGGSLYRRVVATHRYGDLNPVHVINSMWFSVSDQEHTFESRCFSFLRYFFGIFGRVKKAELFAASNGDDGHGGIRGPLKGWIPEMEFELCGCSKSESLSNLLCPSQRGRIISNEQRTLSKEFKEVLKVALTKEYTSSSMARAMWICSFDPIAPVDFVLIVFQLSGQQMTVDLRFAEANDAPQTPNSERLMELSKKAEGLHTTVSRYITRMEVEDGRTIVVRPFEQQHFMMCHRGNDDRMLSPSTFSWKPWSTLLFCK